MNHEHLEKELEAFRDVFEAIVRDWALKILMPWLLHV